MSVRPTLMFDSGAKRTVLANRLFKIAEGMIRSRDQGSHGYFPSDETIDDVRAAAAIVAMCPAKDDPE